VFETREGNDAPVLVNIRPASTDHIEAIAKKGQDSAIKGKLLGELV